MKNLFLFSLVILLLTSCGSESSQENNNDKSNLKQSQLNITILLDLSDRIVRNQQPNQTERDLNIVGNIVDIFKNNMEINGAFKSKDKIRILFTPTPDDPNINNIAKRLNVDLSSLDNKQKKEKFDNMKADFEAGLKDIYQMTVNSKNWIGADIWRFFKYEAKDLCLEKDSSYRNILVIVTDGYIYHENSKDRQKNRTAYVNPAFLQQEGFRNNPNWKSKFQDQDYGFIIPSQQYDNLDILVLEVNPTDNNKNDEDILRAYLNKWFTEMKVSNSEIYNTDLPINTKSKIEHFFKR